VAFFFVAFFFAIQQSPFPVASQEPHPEGLSRIVSSNQDRCCDGNLKVGLERYVCDKLSIDFSCLKSTLTFFPSAPDSCQVEKVFMQENFHPDLASALSLHATHRRLIAPPTRERERA
jgi:hypothetical protein